MANHIKEVNGKLTINGKQLTEPLTDSEKKCLAMHLKENKPLTYGKIEY